MLVTKDFKKQDKATFLMALSLVLCSRWCPPPRPRHHKA